MSMEVAEGGGVRIEPNIKFTRIKVSELNLNPNNPRKVSTKKFKKLKESITNFPDMLKIRPIVIDELNGNMVLGGEQRAKAVKELGWTHVEVVKAGTLSEEQKKEFILKDNDHAGDWDLPVLADNWSAQEISDSLGIRIEAKLKQEGEGDVEFSTELDEESNYVVLKFSRDIDWLQIQSMLGLKSTYSRRQNGKPWSKGIGRVVDGLSAIKKIRESKEE